MGIGNAKSWSVFSFLLLVGLVASIYLVTVLLFPRVPESGGQVDLDAHYHKNRRIFFLANAAAWTLGLLCNLTFLPIRSWLNPGVIFPVLIVFLSILAAITGNRRYHAAFYLCSGHDDVSPAHRSHAHRMTVKPTAS